MTFEEMERALIVQGELMHRVEQAVAHNTEAIAQNTEAIAHNTEAIGKLSDGMLIMQGAMKSLFEHIDRFIRGLESDGHQRGEA
jgi:hypothetical protein